MNLDQLKQNFKTLNERIAAAMDQMKSDSKTLVEQAANELFQVAPEIDHVFWVQYTPYFNDGEPCTFSVHDIYYVLVGESENEDCEGSYLYTQEDYDTSLANLKQVRQYCSDPTGWFDAYKAKHKLPDTAKLEWYRPWPYTVERAQEEVGRIELQREAYTVEDAERINKAFQAFYECMALIPEEIMQAIYGDHSRVVISRNGTEIEEYNHD